MPIPQSPKPPLPKPRRNRSESGRQAQAAGVAAEQLVAAHLAATGWTILGERIRTKLGEIDLAATREGLLLLAEIKSRADHSQAAFALIPRQQKRLISAATWLLAEHPEWGPAGVRFDLFLVDHGGAIDQITDALRDDGQ